MVYKKSNIDSFVLLPIKAMVLKVNESVVSVDHHKNLSISLHTSADVCNEMDNFLWRSTETTD
jgi:hypothetical protein